MHSEKEEEKVVDLSKQKQNHKMQLKVDNLLCDICGTCASVCPAIAITISEFHIKIDPQKCTKCNHCVRVCPAQAISDNPAESTDIQAPATQSKKAHLPHNTLLARDYDAIVIGAGPAGSTTARYIAQGGCSVLMIERDREPGVPVRCAEGVSHAGIIHYIDIDERWISARIEGARLHSPDGQSVEMYNNGSGYVLDRRVFDRALADIAVEKGASLLTKTEAIGLTFDEKNKVNGVKIRHEGAIYEVKAKIVIGADGIESQVGRWAGIPTQLSLQDLDTCCQYTLSNISVPTCLCQFYFGKDVAPGGYLWIFPKSATQANIGIGIGGEYATAEKGPRYYLDKFIDKNFPNASLSYMVYGGVPTRAGNDFIRDNLMLVGDAAHQVNPITGGGIVQGMIAGEYCGDTVVDAIRANDTSAEFMQVYAKKWDAHLGENQRFMYALKTKFMGMNDKIFNTLVATCQRIPRDELNLQRLFMETLKEDPLLLAKLASAFVISRIKKG